MPSPTGISITAIIISVVSAGISVKACADAKALSRYLGTENDPNVVDSDAPGLTTYLRLMAKDLYDHTNLIEPDQVLTIGGNTYTIRHTVAHGPHAPDQHQDPPPPPGW